MKFFVAIIALMALALAFIGGPGTAASGAQPAPTASSSPRPSPTPRPLESLTPDQILSRTENTLRHNPDPTYIAYTMNEIFVHHGRRHEYTYHVWYRNDGQGLMQSAAPGRRGRHETFFGYPFPSAPDNNILLYATPAPFSPAPAPIGSPPAGSSTNPQLLTHESVHGNRYYVVTLAGLEDYHGHQVYHLTLRAVRDERQHPWRDLWVDTQSYQVWKAHADAGGSVGPLSGHAVADVGFAPVGTFWVGGQANARGRGRFGFISDSGHYEYYFSDFSFPMTLPDWYFDEAAFDRHRP